MTPGNSVEETAQNAISFYSKTLPIVLCLLAIVLSLIQVAAQAGVSRIDSAARTESIRAMRMSFLGARSDGAATGRRLRTDQPWT